MAVTYRALLAPLFLLCGVHGACGQAIAPPAQAPALPSAQGPVAEAPTLRVTSRVVALSAVVRGKDNVPIQGLTKEDFELKQDGRDVPIRYFSEASELPLTLALLVDTSGSQRTLISDEVLASDVFLQTMLGRPQDRATLVRVDAEVSELIPMTSSSSRLHLGLLGLAERPAAANGTRLQDAVYAVSKLTLGKLTGRKAIIILSDGGDNGSRTSLQDAIHEAQQFNVQIYCIDYSVFNYAMDLNHSLGGVRAGSVDKGEEVLKALAEQTGGRMFTVGKTNLRTIYEQIGRDLRFQYELGYTPPPDLKPGSFHRLELRTREKKQTVQARNGFTFEP